MRRFEKTSHLYVGLFETRIELPERNLEHPNLKKSVFLQ